MPQGGTWGNCGRLGGQNIFFLLKFNQSWCVSYLHEWHMQRHNFLPGDLGMGSKGQLPLDFFQRVGICDGAPSNVF